MPEVLVARKKTNNVQRFVISRRRRRRNLPRFMGQKCREAPAHVELDMVTIPGLNDDLLSVANRVREHGFEFHLSPDRAIGIEKKP